MRENDLLRKEWLCGGCGELMATELRTVFLLRTLWCSKSGPAVRQLLVNYRLRTQPARQYGRSAAASLGPW